MNNSNFQCPPLMADGRHGTDFRSNKEAHIIMLNKLQVHPNNARNFMQKNASELMSQAYVYAKEINSCKVPTTFIHPDPYESELYMEHVKENWNNINH
jgi:hypothetical protein